MELIICGVISFVIGVAIAFPTGFNYRKNVAEKELGTAENEAKRIVGEALKTAEGKKKEAMIEAKDEIFKLKTEAERELKERRTEATRLERRVQQKLDEAEMVKHSQFEMLEKISGFTVDQAKEYLLQNLDGELTHEKALRITQMETRLKEEADQKARNIISLAIQRCAADQVVETTVSVVPLPSDEMKGRIIGREGRNIRALETLTGVDLIIDDTPEAITLSSHDPVKREIARIALERLINDGRIHPARIEEMVEKAGREVEAKIKTDGDRIVMETGVGNMHPELVKLLGRMRYRSSYGQNVLLHSAEVAYISGMIAAEIGADETLAKRAGLLHDIGKSMTHEVEGSHVDIGVEIAKKYKESPDVIHAIEAHHNDVEPRTIIACIVQAADAISAARPGARRENLENYVKRLEKLEEIANSFEGVEKCYAVQAGREVRVIIKPEIVNDDQMVIIAREIKNRIENELDYPGQIKIHVVRETRAIEFAK
ncbi:MAG: ribonuclease Y [Oscillospiraceae bacterium]